MAKTSTPAFQAALKALSDKFFYFEVRAFLKNPQRPNLDANSDLDNIKSLIFDDIDEKKWEDATDGLKTYETKFITSGPPAKRVKTDRAIWLKSLQNRLSEISQERNETLDRKEAKTKLILQEYERENDARPSKEIAIDIKTIRERIIDGMIPLPAMSMMYQFVDTLKVDAETKETLDINSNVPKFKFLVHAANAIEAKREVVNIVEQIFDVIMGKHNSKE